jgi:pimeloyl-ACP methyl ester carboxylesterase
MNDAHDAAPPAASDEDLHDLIQRVRRTRDVANPWRDDLARGLTAKERNALLEYWATGYNWRAHETRIRSRPWELVTGAGAELRIIHQRSARSEAPAVVLLHGWPDSVLRFERLLPLLTQVHVVVPALPGFPFAAPFSEPGGASVNRLADIVAGAMARLGYQRYVVSGGDVGGMVAEILAAEHPEQVAAIHLTNIAARRAATVDPATLPADAAGYLAGVAHWARAETGFIAEQSTRPSTLMAGLGDSPAGLAAWIGEKLLAWSDRDDGPAFTRDELLTWVTAYWLSGSFGAWEQPQAYAGDVRRALQLAG